MDLLFKREQSSGTTGKVKFKLWGKVELDEDEQAIVRRYSFDEAVLIAAIQPTLLRSTVFIAVGVFIVIAAILMSVASASIAFALAALAGGGVAYWYFNEKRETVFVKDLIHGRYFSCDSIVELARKGHGLRS